MTHKLVQTIEIGRHGGWSDVKDLAGALRIVAFPWRSITLLLDEEVVRQLHAAVMADSRKADEREQVALIAFQTMRAAMTAVFFKLREEGRCSSLTPCHETLWLGFRGPAVELTATCGRTVVVTRSSVTADFGPGGSASSARTILLEAEKSGREVGAYSTSGGSMLAHAAALDLIRDVPDSQGRADGF